MIIKLSKGRLNIYSEITKMHLNVNQKQTWLLVYSWIRHNYSIKHHSPMILEVCTNLTMVKIFDQSALWAQLAMLEKIFHVTLYMDFFIYRQNCCQFFLLIFPHEAGTWDPNGKLHPRGGFFGPWFFIIKFTSRAI